jgi:hypothetical protein
MTGTATFGDPGLTATQWTNLLDCVAADYAAFAVEITDEDPGDVPHLEVVLVPEGQWSMTGLTDQISGVSAFACGGFTSTVVFLNLAAFGADDPYLCEIASQSIATSQGLDHAFYCPDLLSYVTGCNDKAFLDQDVPCGEFEARDCACGGATQNSYRTLADRFGDACP